MTTILSRLHPGLFLLALFLFALPATQAAEAEKVQPYVLPRCIVSGQKLEADAFSFTYEGREIKTCCDQCMEDFYKDPTTYLEKILQAEEKIAKMKRARLLCFGTR